MMNDKWILYIMASINKHFETNLVGDVGLPIALFYEGLCRTAEQNNSENLVEVRYTGPFITKTGKSSWKYLFIINCTLQTTINETNNYKIWRIFGKVNTTYALPILIFNYEEGNNSPTQIGCLRLTTNKQDIVNNYLGQIDPNVKRVQGEVTAHYTIELEE